MFMLSQRVLDIEAISDTYYLLAKKVKGEVFALQFTAGIYDTWLQLSGALGAYLFSQIKAILSVRLELG